MSRPRGSVGAVRRALTDAAWRLAVERSQQGMSYRDLAQAACVGFGAAQVTVRNMARAGQLVPIAEAHASGRGRPMKLYAPAPDADAYTQRCLDLSNAINTWHRR